MIAELEQAVNRPVSRETFEKLEQFASLLRFEAKGQNLISASTSDQLWPRHILDSAQLVRFDTPKAASWVDIGSGGGLPGVVIAILLEKAVRLVEPRRLRAAFLQTAVDQLRLANTKVEKARVESVEGKFDIITARAVAPLTKLLGITAHLSHPGTLWILPKGRNANSELAEAHRSWHYDLRAEPSCTDADSQILLLSNVRAKRRS
jgi:16S rRNA (guanine527-N7)-methyltransferase